MIASKIVSNMDSKSLATIGRSLSDDELATALRLAACDGDAVSAIFPSAGPVVDKAPLAKTKPASGGDGKAAATWKPRKKSGGGKREKRTPEELADILDRLAEHITGSPGQGAEQIGKALGMSSKALSLPIRKLIAAGRLGFTGAKRATRYYPKGHEAIGG